MVQLLSPFHSAHLALQAGKQESGLSSLRSLIGHRSCLLSLPPLLLLADNLLIASQASGFRQRWLCLLAPEMMMRVVLAAKSSINCH